MKKGLKIRMAEKINPKTKFAGAGVYRVMGQSNGKYIVENQRNGKTKSLSRNQFTITRNKK